MTINFSTKTGLFVSFALAGWLVAVFDNLLIQLYIPQIILFPFIVLLIYFFTRYNENRHIYLGLFILIYFLVFTIPVWLSVILLASIYILEKIITLSLSRFNIIQVLATNVVVVTVISFIYVIQLSALSFFSWDLIIIDWSIASIENYVIRVIFSLLLGMIIYPFLSVYEAKHKLYLNPN